MTKLKPAGSFTAGLWRAAEPLFRMIMDSPFYTGLASGRLSKEGFREFLSQDVLYLGADTEAIRLTAGIVSEGRERAFFEALVKDGIALERALHQRLAADFGTPASPGMNPSCRAYTDHLLGTAAAGCCAESAAALLPCFWIYQAAGLDALSKSAPGNPYADWLETYSGGQFTAYTLEFISICEALAARENDEVRSRMRSAFHRSVELELGFISPFQ